MLSAPNELAERGLAEQSVRLAALLRYEGCAIVAPKVNSALSYHERWRERPDEARQPADLLVRAVPSPAAAQPLKDESDARVRRLLAGGKLFCLSRKRVRPMDHG